MDGFNGLAKDINEILGVKDTNLFTLHRGELEELLRERSQIEKAQSILSSVQNPFIEEFSHDKSHAIFEVAMVSLPEKTVQLKLNISNFRLKENQLSVLNSSLPHLIRNALDHGVEDFETRLNAKKKETATLTVSSKALSNGFQISIEDDGKGIDGEHIAKLAVEKGLLTKEKVDLLEMNEKINLIALAGFSTKEEVIELSGRGVGMDAVKSFVSEIGGELLIESTPNIGTKVTLTFL